MLVKAQAKYIQSLGQKKHRDEYGVFIAEGPKVVGELLQTGAVQHLYALKGWIDANKHIIGKVDTVEISEAELEKISHLTTPNQVLAIVRKYERQPLIQTKGKFVLVLDTIQDPGNLGTIIRTADWFGIDQLVCSSDCADIYNSKVVQSTMGSIARVKVLYANLTEWLSSQNEVQIFGAFLDGQDITSMNKPGDGIIVIGNESKGINSEIIQLINVRITIPQKGGAESLNAAVATGIILSHIV